MYFYKLLLFRKMRVLRDLQNMLKRRAFRFYAGKPVLYIKYERRMYVLIFKHHWQHSKTFFDIEVFQRIEYNVFVKYAGLSCIAHIWAEIKLCSPVLSALHGQGTVYRNNQETEKTMEQVKFGIIGMGNMGTGHLRFSRKERSRTGELRR